MENLIGQTIGNYQLISALGQGGMGVVYRAYQESLRRYVALKMLRAEMAHDDTFVARFLREARLAAGLRHKHIVRVYEVSRAAPHFIAMEFVEGEPLSALLQRERMLNPARAAELARQIANALDYAHGRGIVHRDIKPANILIERGTGRVVLSDFGIARALASSHYSRPGQMLGTPEYMAPELAHGDEASAQSDNYALGIVLYEMLAGRQPFRGFRVPFRGDTSTMILDQHVRDPIPPLRQLNPTLPEAVEAVMARALAKNPIERYATATELAQNLASAVGAPTVSTPPSPYRPATRAPNQQAFILLGIGGGVIALILILLIIFNQQASQMPNPGGPQNTALAVVPTNIERVTEILPKVAPATLSPGVTRVFTPPTAPPTNTSPAQDLNPDVAVTPSRTPTTTATVTPTRALPPARAASIFGQIASAVDYAHAQGVIHRDIKPANVLMEQGKDEVFLGDFGLARMMEGTDITRGGNAGGTAEYLAPEQARNQPATAASDVYSLGVTLYEMLTGQVPFSGENPIAIMHQHAKAPPPPPRHLKPELSPDIERILLKALAKDPRRRYASAGEMARDLSAAVRAHTATIAGRSPRAARTRSAAYPTGAPPRQTLIYLGLGALAILVIVTLLVMILSARNAAPTPSAANSVSSSTVAPSASLPPPTLTPNQAPGLVLPTGNSDGGGNLTNPTVFALVVTATPTVTPVFIIVTATPPPTATPTETQPPSPTATSTLSPTRAPTRAPTRPRVAVYPTEAPCGNPQAQIIDPPANGVYRQNSVLTVRGTASRPNYHYWRIHFQAEGAIDWIQLYPDHPISRFAPTSTAVPQVANGILMKWDLSTVQPGGYLLRLIVEDSTGSYFDPPCTVRVVVVP